MRLIEAAYRDIALGEFEKKARNGVIAARAEFVLSWTHTVRRGAEAR